MNNFLIKEFDSWLASQSSMYTEYLNPLSFVMDAGINKKLGLLIFAKSCSKENFQDNSALLRIKYLVDCPDCLSNYATYYNSDDIPDYYVECDEEECSMFIPKRHPERIEIYFELLESPNILEDEELQLYDKGITSPLTAADEDVESLMLKYEENKH